MIKFEMDIPEEFIYKPKDCPGRYYPQCGHHAPYFMPSSGELAKMPDYPRKEYEEYISILEAGYCGLGCWQKAQTNG